MNSASATSPVRLDPIDAAVDVMRAGGSVIVVDDEGRENEGDLIFPAATATAEQTAFMIRHTSGFICVGMEGADLDRLNLPPMTAVNEDRKGTAYAVTVDSRAVSSTGISAADRATTMRTLADPAASPYDLTRPGHVMPLRAVPGGVLRRPGHTEAAVDLAKLAGLPPAGALCEMVNDDGTMMDAADCRRFGDEHGLLLVSIADLMRHRLATDRLVQRTEQTMLPTEVGMFNAVGYRNTIDDTEHLALFVGDLGDGTDVLVRVHAECLYGDVFGSDLCACRQRLHRSLAIISGEGRGVLVYVRAPSDGSAPSAHPPTNALGEVGHSPVDDLDYGIGSQILADLGVRRMTLITAHPGRSYHIKPFGLEITGARQLD